MGIKKRKKEHGFTHLEVLLSMSMFIIAISFLLTMQSQLFAYSHNEDQKEKMIMEATNIIEQLKSGAKIEDIKAHSEYEIQYEELEQKNMYKEIKLTIIHPKDTKRNLTFEHYILKQEVKAYAEETP